MDIPQLDLDKVSTERRTIIVSQYGAFHGRSGAEAAHESGLLKHFVTNNCTYTNVPSDYIEKTSRLDDIVPIALRVLGKATNSPSLIKYAREYGNHQFIERTSKLINSQINVFHAYSSFHEKCWNVCDAFGVKKFIDFGIAHPHFLNNIIREEGERLGIEVFDDPNLQRSIDELDAVDLIFIPSSFVKKTFDENGHKKINLVLNHYGVNHGYFFSKKQYQNQGPLRVATAGLMNLRKGHYYLLEAVQQLRKENLPIQLYMFGNPVPNMTNFFSRYRYTWEHQGNVPHHQLIDWYANIDVFVLPSLAEGMSRAVLEAMACGGPCIVTPNCGYNELIIDGQNGHIVPIRDIDDLKEKLVSLYKHREKLVSMSKMARETALNNSWSRYKETLVSYYLKYLK